MTLALLFVLLLLAPSPAAAGAPLLPRRVNEFPLKHVAVASFDAAGFEGGPALLLTTFYPFGEDGVYVVPAIAGAFAGKPANVTALDTKAVWPNQADPVPAGAIASKANGSFVLAAGGFFVSPSKSTGSIDLLDVSAFPAATTKTTISEPRKSNFYHQALWLDVNGDGRQDVIAARAFKSMNPFSKAEGDLVWLEQPAEGAASSGPWVERQITGFDGPGVGFALCDLDGDGKTEIVATQFFVAQQLSIWWCEAEQWSGCVNGTSVGSAVIDAAEDAPFFNVQWVDLNGDGKKELLATTNTASGKGAVLAYEQPSEAEGGYRNGSAWRRHVLADGYKPKKAFLPGRGSPGRALAFRATSGDQPPSIIVSADDGGWVDLLVPTSTTASGSASAFAYDKHRLLNSTDTVGSPAVSDVDGDGYADIAIPLFAENKVALYTFSPAAAVA